MNLLLSLCLMFCIIPFKPTTPLLTPVLASSDFIIDEAGALVSYEGEESVIVIPDEVITIKERAFYENQTITSVKMGNQVTTIEIEAFANCQNLQNVELSSNIVSIGKEAFMNTTSLESIEIPASLSTVGYSSLGVFYQSGLKKAVIEEGMIEMPFYLFRNATALEDVTLPSTLEKIYDGGFYNCSALERIDLPESLTYLGGSIFYNCKRLSDVTLPSKLEYMGIDVFENCVALTSINIPKSLNRIASTSDGIFKGSSLKEVHFEEGITTIPTYLFKNTTSLKSIEFPKTLERINDGAFMGCNGLTEVHLPEGFNHLRRHAFALCKKLNIVTGLDELTYFDEKAFASSSKICLYVQENTLAHQVALNKGWNYVLTTKPQPVEMINIQPLTDTSFQLTWESDGQNDGYLVEYYPTSDETAKKSIQTTEKVIEIDNLDTNKSYVFEVKAMNMYTPVAIYSKVTKKIYDKTYKIPQILKMEQASSSALRITWEPCRSGNVIELYRSTSKDGAYKLMGTYESTKTSVILAGQKTGKTYYFKIKEASSGTDVIECDFSDVKSGSTQLYKNTLKIEKGETIKLKWNAVSGASYYQIYRAKGHGEKFKKMITLANNKRAYTLKAKTTSKAYYYKIRGYKNYSSGKVYSPFSNIVKD